MIAQPACTLNIFTFLSSCILADSSKCHVLQRDPR
jgi:hypothetical protein